MVSAALRIKLIGANRDAAIEGADKMPGRINYMIGKPSGWHTKVPLYGSVRYRSIYPGVDVVYYGSQSGIEYDMVVAPGADPSKIAFALDGADKTALTKSGDILMTTRLGAITMRKPLVYQEDAHGARHSIDGHYVMVPSSKKNQGAQTVEIALADYDHNRKLIIDPQLMYATYIGGTGDDGGTVQGFAVFQVISSNLPASAIPKLADVALDVAVGSNNIAYIAGAAYSTDFPAFPIQAPFRW